jgi:DNA-directed RNA polymerase specialized sigma24 family protein
MPDAAGMPAGAPPSPLERLTVLRSSLTAAEATVRRLRAERRLTCLAARGEGMSYREIGKALGVSHVAARKITEG